MDKYEYRLKTEEMLKCVASKNFKKAETIADSIDWRRVKSVSMLCTVSDIYNECGRYSDAREILFIAYDRAPGSRKIIFGLAELAIKLGDLDEASDCYDEFIAVAPKDGNQYILKYELSKAKHEPLEKQLAALEEFKQIEYIERWAYELAKLYEQAGMTAKCIEECDDLVLWFSEGKYVRKALDLKRKYKPLTPLQAEKYTMSLKQRFDEPSESQREATLLLDEERKMAERRREAAGQKDTAIPQGEPDGAQNEAAEEAENVTDAVYEDKYEGQAAEEAPEAMPSASVRQGETRSDADLDKTVDISIDQSVIDMAEIYDRQNTGSEAPLEAPEEEQRVAAGDGDASGEAGVYTTGTAGIADSDEEQGLELKTEFAEDISDKVRDIQLRMREEERRVETERKAAEEAQKRAAEEVAFREREEAQRREAEERERAAEADRIRNEEIARREEAARREEEEQIAAEAARAAAEAAASDVEHLTADTANAPNSMVDPEHIDVKPVKVGIYDTMNMQAEIARGMAEIMAQDEAAPESAVQNRIEEPTEELETLVQDANAEQEVVADVPADTSADRIDAEQKESVAQPAIPPVSQPKLAEEDDGQMSLVAAAKSLQTEKQITGQMDIEEILSQWETKQQEMKKSLEESEEKYAAEEKKRQAALKAINAPTNIIPDDIQRILDEIESDDFNDDNSESVTVEEAESSYSEDRADKPEEAADRGLSQEPAIAAVTDASSGAENTSFADDITSVSPSFKTCSIEIDDEEIPQEQSPRIKTQEFEVDHIAEALESMVGGKTEKPSDVTAAEDGSGAASGTDTDEPLLSEAHEERPEDKPAAEVYEDGRASRGVITDKPLIKTSTATNETYAGNPDETQGGLTIEEKFDLEAQSRVGTEAGLSEDEKKLFSYFVPVRGMSEQLVDVLNKDRECDHDGTSSTGNLLIMGSKGSGKTVLAVDVVKAIQKSRRMKSGKVAIISAESLNNKDVPSTIRKVNGGSLIIENAGSMTAQTVEALNMAMTTQTGDLLIVLEDQRRSLSELLLRNNIFAGKFTMQLEVPIFINDELVTFGQAYAKEHGYRIEEMGILALYSRIDAMQREDHAVTVAEVKDIMDEAFVKSKRNSMKRTMTNLFKNHDKSDKILLMEEDFANR